MAAFRSFVIRKVGGGRFCDQGKRLKKGGKEIGRFALGSKRKKGGEEENTTFFFFLCQEGG